MPESCSIEGCERIKWARGWCPLHYQRWRKHGDPLVCRPRFWASTEPCLMDGCDERERSRGLCERHYQHWWKYGTPTTRPTYEVCTIEDCGREPRSPAAGLCEMHYYRLRRNGHMKLLDTRAEKPGYRAAHGRIAKDRGKAKGHGCIDCGGQAAHWSFAWRDVPVVGWLWETFNGCTLAYTGDPSDYEPRCGRCAKLYDQDFAKEGWRMQVTRQEQPA